MTQLGNLNFLQEFFNQCTHRVDMRNVSVEIALIKRIAHQQNIPLARIAGSQKQWDDFVLKNNESIRHRLLEAISTALLPNQQKLDEENTTLISIFLSELNPEEQLQSV